MFDNRAVSSSFIVATTRIGGTGLARCKRGQLLTQCRANLVGIQIDFCARVCHWITASTIGALDRCGNFSSRSSLNATFAIVALKGGAGTESASIHSSGSRERLPPRTSFCAWTSGASLGVSEKAMWTLKEMLFVELMRWRFALGQPRLRIARPGAGLGSGVFALNRRPESSKPWSRELSATATF